MPLRSPLTRSWRARWLESAYPMVVEHNDQGIASMCAAPSLWMRARELQPHLQDLAARPGESLALATPPGVAWVQALAAGLRFGLQVWPEDTPRASLRFDGADIARVQEASTSLEDEGGVWTHDGSGWRMWSEHILLERATEHACEPELRVLCQGDWRHPDLLLDGVLMTLCAQAELHVLQPGVERDALALTDSHPDLIITSAP